MKKTFNINVAGFPFTIDDDAYTLLSDYLDTIEHAFSRIDDSDELVNDIENRVAELLIECTSSGSTIVTAKDVEEVIRRVGQPEEMVEEDETLNISLDKGTESVEETIKETVTPPPYIPPLPPIKKKLYRDPQNAILGGVCSGLAHYFNAEPSTIRLITVLLTVVSVSTMGIAYLILWIVYPEAKTPYERLQMLGEQPTFENIGKTVTNSFKEEASQGQPDAPVKSHNFGDTLANFFGICAKVLVILGLIIAVPLLIAMVTVLIGLIFALIAFGTGMEIPWLGNTIPDWYEEIGHLPFWGIICGIGCILTLGIPLYLLIRLGLKKNKTPMSNTLKTSLVIIWILGLIGGAVATGRVLNIASELDKMEGKRIVILDEDSNIDIIINDDSIEPAPLPEEIVTDTVSINPNDSVSVAVISKANN